MLPQERRRTPQPAVVSDTHFRRLAEEPQWADRRGVRLREPPEAAAELAVQRVVESIDGRSGDARGVDRLQPMRGRPLAKALLQQLAKDDPILHPPGIV